MTYDPTPGQQNTASGRYRRPRREARTRCTRSTGHRSRGGTFSPRRPDRQLLVV